MPKTKTVASAKSMGVVRRFEPPQTVKIQFSTMSIAGTLMRRVKSMKPWPSSGLIPVMNMWWP